MIGSAAFFDPLAATVPCNRTGPVTRRQSIVLSSVLRGGQRVTKRPARYEAVRRAVTTLGCPARSLTAPPNSQRASAAISASTDCCSIGLISSKTDPAGRSRSAACGNSRSMTDKPVEPATRAARLVLADVRRQGRELLFRDVGGIADDVIERLLGRHCGEQVALDKRNPLGHLEPLGILAGHGQGGRTHVDRRHAHVAAHAGPR